MPVATITTADAKSHLRVYHAQDDIWIADIVARVAAEWERVTHWRLSSGTSTQYVASLPEDRYLRHYLHPVDTVQGGLVEYTDAAGSLVSVNLDEGQFQRLDGYTLMPITDAQAAAWVFPITYTYGVGAFTVPSDIRSALLLRIGYLYGYRGDDPSPPDDSFWLRLCARHKTGALL